MENFNWLLQGFAELVGIDAGDGVGVGNRDGHYQPSPVNVDVFADMTNGQSLGVRGVNQSFAWVRERDRGHLERID